MLFLLYFLVLNLNSYAGVSSQQIKFSPWEQLDLALTSGVNTSDTKVANALIERLQIEVNSKRINTFRGEAAEGYIEYLIKLIEHVSSIRDDSIVKPLVDSLEIVGGIFIPNQLAKYREKSLQVLTKKYSNVKRKEGTRSVDSQHAKITRTRVLHAMNQVNIHMKSSRSAISRSVSDDMNSIFFDSLKDSDPFIREQAVSALKETRDRRVISKLESILINERHSSEVKNTIKDLKDYLQRKLY